MRRFASMLRSLADRLDPVAQPVPFAQFSQRIYKLEKVEQSITLPLSAKADLISVYRRRLFGDLTYDIERFIEFETMVTPEGVTLKARLMVGRVTHV